VFSLLDKFVRDGRLTVGYVFGNAAISLTLWVVGAYIEHRKP
jgi:hypothetical protein